MPAVFSFGDNPIAHSSPQGFINQANKDKAVSDARYRFGMGYGSDMNGLAAQSAPTCTPYTVFMSNGR